MLFLCLHVVSEFRCEHFGIWIEAAGSQDLCPQPVLEVGNFRCEPFGVGVEAAHFRFIPEKTDNLQVAG